MKKPRTIKFHVQGQRWFDKENGNTYHSARITRAKDGAQLFCEWSYGYEDAYRQTALEAMANAGWLPKKYQGRDEGRCFRNAFDYERENNYPIDWNVRDGLKREMIANGREG